MNKIFAKGLLGIFLLLIPIFSYATNNIKITTENTGKTTTNDQFEEMGANGEFFYVSTGGEKGLKGLIMNIARDLKTMAFVLVIFLIIIMVIKLLFSENTEEQQKKLKMGILWSTIGIMVMQVAYSVYKILFDQDIGATLGRRFSEKIVEPFTELLMLIASFIFIAMGIYAFYKIVTAGGNDEGIKKGKSTIFQAIIGFIVIKISHIIVTNTFNPDCGGGGIISYWGTDVCENVKDNSKIFITLINWINSFLAIIIVIMIIYAGFLVMTGGGEEEKNKKAKKIILYSAIGLFILFASYMILTFFIIPESKI